MPRPSRSARVMIQESGSVTRTSMQQIFRRAVDDWLLSLLLFLLHFRIPEERFTQLERINTLRGEQDKHDNDGA